MPNKQLKKGDVIKTSLGENTVVLDIREDSTVLFSGTQFVIAKGIKENERKGIYEWSSGKYARDLKSISNMKNENFEDMKETLSFLLDSNHRNFIKGLISIEMGIEDENTLDNMYDDYMREDEMGLINDRFFDFMEQRQFDVKKDFLMQK